MRSIFSVDQILGVYCAGMIPPGPDYRDIRGTYIRLVNDMRAVEAEMMSTGATDEQVARVLVDMRNAAKLATRPAMSPEDVAKLEAAMFGFGSGEVPPVDPGPEPPIDPVP